MRASAAARACAVFFIAVLALPGHAALNYELVFDAPAELIQRIRSETLLGRWQERPEYEPEQLEALVFRSREEIEVVLRGEGYFDFEVAVNEQSIVGGRRAIKIDVSAGARTTVNEFLFSLKGDAQADKALTQKLLSNWALSEGSFYRAASWEQAKKSALDLLQQQGYLAARISASKVSVDVRNTTAGLDVQIESGPRYQFGAVEIKGLSRYNISIINALRNFKEGDPYRLDALIEMQTRLRDSGYFSGVTVAPQLSEILANSATAEGQEKGSNEDLNKQLSKDLRVPVLVDLTERESKRFLTGIGFSTDQGPRAQIGFENRNLLGQGLQFETGVLAERVRTRVFATVKTPFDQDGHYYALGARLERFDLLGERADKNTVFVQRGRRSTDIDSIFTLQYQTERLLIDPGTGLKVGDRATALTVGYSWNLRRVDSRLDPRVGHTITAQTSFAFKGLASDQSFVRFYTRAMNFIPLTSDFWPKGATLVTLGEIGIVAAPSRSGIPSENLFRAGGAQSIRGYRYLGLGANIGTAVVGARYLAIVSAEYQQPIYKNLLATTFIDVGDASDARTDFKAKIGTGVGLRWRSPIGPINMEAAYGQDDRRWRLHLSVGYTF